MRRWAAGRLAALGAYPHWPTVFRVRHELERRFEARAVRARALDVHVVADVADELESYRPSRGGGLAAEVPSSLTPISITCSAQAREKCGENAEFVTDYLIAVVEDEAARLADRNEAAELLLERDWGKAQQAVDLSVNQPQTRLPSSRPTTSPP